MFAHLVGIPDIQAEKKWIQYLQNWASPAPKNNLRLRFTITKLIITWLSGFYGFQNCSSWVYKPLGGPNLQNIAFQR